MNKIVAIIFLSLTSTQLFAQAGFAKTFSLGKLTEAHKVIQTSDSGFIVCGRTTDTSTSFFWKIFLLKLDKNGDSIWSRKYGPFSEPGVGGVFQLNTGEFVIGFDTHIGGYDLYLNFLETTAQGDSLFYIPADTTFSGGRLKMAGSENIYVSGARGSYDYYWNFHSVALIRKYDKNLQLLWEKQLQSDQYAPTAYGEDVLLDNDEGITVSGGFNEVPFGPIIDEIDSSGTVTWYLTGGDIASLECVGPPGNLGRANGGIIFSVTVPFTSNVFLRNLDSLHSLLWQRQVFVNPFFFHQWNNGDITMFESNFGYMDISESGDSIDTNNDYVLPSAVAYDASECFDESLIAGGSNCGNCYDQKQAYIVKFKPEIVGIGDDYLESVKERIFVFPNPCDKHVSLVLPTPFESIRLFSTDGKLIQQFNHLHQSRFDLDAGALSSGMYFIAASSNNKIYTAKILVSH